MRCDDTHTHVPKLSQSSICRFDAGWIVTYTAEAIESTRPSIEHERATYLGKAAEYAFCVSSVAVPSSSWYKSKASLDVLLCLFDVALLKSVKIVGIEVMKTDTKAVKPTMAEGREKGSIVNKKRRKEGEKERV